MSSPFFPPLPPDPISPILPAPVVFNRVTVDYLIVGNARIIWEMDTHFREPYPWTFQLQVAEADVGPDSNSNWANVGGPLVNTFLTTDPTRRLTGGKEQNIVYRLAVTTGLGNTYYSPPADILGNLDFKSFRLAQEIIRKEDLRHRRQRASIEGYVLKAKRSGIPCPECIDKYTEEVTDSKCKVCWGTRWTGGYYAPMPAIYCDLALTEIHLRRDLQTEGMVLPSANRARFLAMPFLTAYDIWVNKTSDERFFIHPVKTEAMIRGVPIVVNYELRGIPYDDVMYEFPVPRE
jgi:hypothetical protein